MAERAFPGRLSAIAPSSVVSGPATLNPASHDPLGDRLKCFFDGVTSGPMPDRMVRLAAELEAALDRGDIGCAKRPGRSPQI